MKIFNNCAWLKILIFWGIKMGNFCHQVLIYSRGFYCINEKQITDYVTVSPPKIDV